MVQGGQVHPVQVVDQVLRNLVAEGPRRHRPHLVVAPLVAVVAVSLVVRVWDALETSCQWQAVVAVGAAVVLGAVGQVQSAELLQRLCRLPFHLPPRVRVHRKLRSNARRSM